MTCLLQYEENPSIGKNIAQLGQFAVALSRREVDAENVDDLIANLDQLGLIPWDKTQVCFLNFRFTRHIICVCWLRAWNWRGGVSHIPLMFGLNIPYLDNFNIDCKLDDFPTQYLISSYLSILITN